VECIVRGETEAEVTLVDTASNKIVIKKDDNRDSKVSAFAMPENLQTAWKPEEFVDVVAFLESLKTRRRIIRRAGEEKVELNHRRQSAEA